MIYRAVRIDDKAYLAEGDDMVSAENNVNEVSLDELEAAPVLHIKTVQVGSETFLVGGQNPVTVQKECARLYEMARRVDQEDAFFRVRNTDDGEFAEFVSPSLGYAVKAVSKYNREPAEYYIGAGTPWVKWDKEEEAQFVMFDEDAFDYEPRKLELNELGFAEAGVWYKAERAKMKTSQSDRKKFVWRKLD